MITKKIATANLALFLCLSGAACLKPPQAFAQLQRPEDKPRVIDAVVVSVDAEIILLSEIQKAVQAASNGQSKLTSDGKLEGGPLAKKDLDQIVEGLIDQKILAIRVRERSLNVSDDELEAKIGNLLKEQNLSREDLEKQLRANGETLESYREEFRKQLETQNFIGAVIRPLVTVTDTEVRNFYLQNQGTNTTKEKIKLRSLVINLPSGISEAEKRTKLANIETIEKEVASNGDFGNLVKLYSESADAQKNGGQLPPRLLTELPKELQEKLKTAKPNSVIGPLTIGSSVFFFQHQGSISDTSQDYEKQKPTLERKLQDIKFQERLQEYIRAERAKVRIKKRDFLK